MIDFANNLSVTAVNLVNTTVNGTYAVSSELNVFLKLNFQVTLVYFIE
jgi:hypothetical protein